MSFTNECFHVDESPDYNQCPLSLKEGQDKGQKFRTKDEDEEEKEEEAVMMKNELLEEEFVCSCCSDILLEPTTLTCGHTFCRFCLAEWWNKSSKTECLLCRRPFSEFPSVNFTLRLV